MIKKLLTENTNIIEIYVMNTQHQQMRMNIYLDDIFLNKLKRIYKKKILHNLYLHNIYLHNLCLHYFNLLREVLRILSHQHL